MKGGIISMTKETLENGIVIGENGEIRGYVSFDDLKEGELSLRLSWSESQSQFKKSESVEQGENGTLIRKTPIQALYEAIYTSYYLGLAGIKSSKG